MSDGQNDLPDFTPDQRRAAFSAPLLVLRFLVEPSYRKVFRAANSDFASLSDSAVFRRLYDLAWTLNERQVIALLTADEQAARTEFDEAFGKLAWRQTNEFPHISELPDDELSSLVPSGMRLLRQLAARSSASAGNHAHAQR